MGAFSEEFSGVVFEKAARQIGARLRVHVHELALGTRGALRTGAPALVT